MHEQLDLIPMVLGHPDMVLDAPYGLKVGLKLYNDAVRDLLKIGKEKAGPSCEVLRKVLADPQFKEKEDYLRLAIYALGKLQYQEAIGEISSFLKPGNPSVLRDQAAISLSETGKAWVVRTLWDALRAEISALRSEASRPSVEMRTLEEGEEGLWLRVPMGLSSSLVELLDLLVISILPCMQDPDSKKAAIRALARIINKGWDFLLKSEDLSEDTKFEALAVTDIWGKERLYDHLKEYRPREEAKESRVVRTLTDWQKTKLDLPKVLQGEDIDRKKALVEETGNVGELILKEVTDALFLVHRSLLRLKERIKQETSDRILKSQTSLIKRLGKVLDPAIDEVVLATGGIEPETYDGVVKAAEEIEVQTEAAREKVLELGRTSLATILRKRKIHINRKELRPWLEGLGRHLRDKLSEYEKVHPMPRTAEYISPVIRMSISKLERKPPFPPSKVVADLFYDLREWAGKLSEPTLALHIRGALHVKLEGLIPGFKNMATQVEAEVEEPVMTRTMKTLTVRTIDTFIKEIGIDRERLKPSLLEAMADEVHDALYRPGDYPELRHELTGLIKEVTRSVEFVDMRRIVAELFSELINRIHSATLPPSLKQMLEKIVCRHTAKALLPRKEAHPG